MSLEGVSNAVKGTLSGIKNGTVNGANWCGRQVCKIAQGIKSLNIPSRTIDFIKAVWKQAVALVTAAVTFLLTNTGIGAIAILVTGGLIAISETQFQGEEYRVPRIACNVAAIAAGCLAFVAFTASAPILL